MDENERDLFFYFLASATANILVYICIIIDVVVVVVVRLTSNWKELEHTYKMAIRISVMVFPMT